MIHLSHMGYSPQAAFTIGSSLVILIAVIVGHYVGCDGRPPAEIRDHAAERAEVVAAMSSSE